MQPVPDILATVLPRLLARAPLTPEKLQFAWRAAVGPQLARTTRIEWRDRRIVVSAEDMRWVDEVERAAHLILPKLRVLLGDENVTGITIAGR